MANVSKEALQDAIQSLRRAQQDYVFEGDIETVDRYETEINKLLKKYYNAQKKIFSKTQKIKQAYAVSR